MFINFGDTLTKAFDVCECLQFAVALVVWPVSLTTLCVIGYRCFREKRFIDALPLLATQFNSALIWTSQAAYFVGFFNHKINNEATILKGDFHSLRNYAIRSTLVSLIYLEPLNLFLYTWRFLSQLDREETSTFLKRLYRWFTPISIVLLVLSFNSIVAVGIIEGS